MVQLLKYSYIVRQICELGLLGPIDLRPMALLYLSSCWLLGYDTSTFKQCRPIDLHLL